MVSEGRELGDHRLGPLRQAAEPATAQPPVSWRVAVNQKTTIELTEMSRSRREAAQRPWSLVSCGEIFHSHPNGALTQLAGSEAVWRYQTLPEVMDPRSLIDQPLALPIVPGHRVGAAFLPALALVVKHLQDELPWAHCASGGRLPRDRIELRSRPATAHRLLSPGNQLSLAILQSVSDEFGAKLIVDPRDVRIVLYRANKNSFLAQLFRHDRIRATEKWSSGIRR